MIDRIALRDLSKKTFFENFDFSPFLPDFLTKEGSKPPIVVENMPLQSDKIISFGGRCHFQPLKLKNIKCFSYPKIL